MGNIPNANSIQNTAQTHHQETQPHTTPRDRAGRAQYGYKPGHSALDALIKIERYIQEGPKGTQILLMDISKAFDAINSTQLWTTLYKKGIPPRNHTTYPQRAPKHIPQSKTSGGIWGRKPEQCRSLPRLGNKCSN